MTDSQTRYNQYKTITQKAADFNNAAAVLGWDQEVYMPKEGFAFRGRQLATLASQAHELVTSERYRELLEELHGSNDLDEQQQDNVRLSYEDLKKNSKLSPSFIEQLTTQTSNSYSAWIKARSDKDFKTYLPELEKMVELKKQQAELYGYEGHPYNALLDDYEKGANVTMLDRVFHAVRDQFPPLMQQIKECDQVDDAFFRQHYDREKQFAFTTEVLKQMGYNFDAGRQDYSEHPFSTSFSPADVRVTTRVNEEDLSSIIWSSIHEGGHALYEQGLPESQYGLPLGAAVSLSIHESQSRLWENMAGRSLQFWEFFYPMLQQVFPDQLGNVPLRSFYRGMNKVQPSLVRTEADEVTYHFHVMIRYEIEKQLLSGALQVKELPEVWNSYYQRYLGVTPPDDKLGVLQDVHWSHGSFGYFPTYSLGSFYAAQFFEQASKDLKTLLQQIQSGSFGDLLKWLRMHIHQYGRKYTSEELCMRVTGKGLDISSFMNYARTKYADIYGFSTKE